jgi:hypothetical protein
MQTPKIKEIVAFVLCFGANHVDTVSLYRRNAEYIFNVEAGGTN